MILIIRFASSVVLKPSGLGTIEKIIEKLKEFLLMRVVTINTNQIKITMDK